jgi:DNA-binding IclR family transcriptional regulator
VLQTIRKVGPLLDLFTVEHPEWGVSEAAEAIGMPRSSTHALMKSLLETGLLSSPGRGRYRLGWRIVELYEVIRAGLDVRVAAAAVLERLNGETGETVNLAVLDRGDVFYLDKVASRLQLSVHGLRPGSRLEPHCNALGKALLAFISPVEASRIIRAKPLRQFTQHTITDPERLLVVLEEIRRTGVAYEDEEVVPDVACVACPVKDPYGAAIAAVSITVPAQRMRAKRAELTRAVRAAAAEIGRRLVEQQESQQQIVPPDDPLHLGGPQGS